MRKGISFAVLRPRQVAPRLSPGDLAPPEALVTLPWRRSRTAPTRRSIAYAIDRNGDPGIENDLAVVKAELVVVKDDVEDLKPTRRGLQLIRQPGGP